jgi:hypothetical protein
VKDFKFYSEADRKLLEGCERALLGCRLEWSKAEAGRQVRSCSILSSDRELDQGGCRWSRKCWLSDIF